MINISGSLEMFENSFILLFGLHKKHYVRGETFLKPLQTSNCRGASNALTVPCHTR